ncbi:unnamed protein product [Rotaria sp. Silwood1]|nr:unnamed protein product [Rotaria sp. Silwood1]
MNTDCHLFTLPQIESDDHNDTSFDESDLEVISIVDETDNIAILIKNHFNLDDDDEDNNNEEATDVQQLNLVLNSNNTELDEDLDDLNADIVSTDQSSLLGLSSAVSNLMEENPLCKRKRRQWSTAEKLHAVDMQEEADGDKLLTSKKEGCSRYQLSQWVKQKEDLIQLSKQKNDRTAPTIQLNASTTTTPIVVKREKITFKQLQRRGKQLCIELKHEHPPSTKWHGRFMRRYRLSLQKPKRQHKVPLCEVHLLITSFHTYIRCASTWGPKCGAMSAFLPRDMANMDESPLSLLGDQTKL